MKEIKTRDRSLEGRSHSRNMGIGAGMKNVFIRTKDRAEEMIARENESAEDYAYEEAQADIEEVAAAGIDAAKSGADKVIKDTRERIRTRDMYARQRTRAADIADVSEGSSVPDDGKASNSQAKTSLQRKAAAAPRDRPLRSDVPAAEQKPEYIAVLGQRDVPTTLQITDGKHRLHGVLAPPSRRNCTTLTTKQHHQNT